jgi:hypothetical protein
MERSLQQEKHALQVAITTTQTISSKGIVVASAS